MPDVLGRLDDMIAAIEVSESFLRPAERSLTIVEIMALERAIEIVSEAGRYIPESMKARFADTPWRQIAGIGNVLCHDYRRISRAMIIKVAVEDFPALKGVLMEIRDAVERDCSS